MILTIDIGNSNICFGLHENNQSLPTHFERVATDRNKEADEYARLLSGILAYHHVMPDTIDKIGLSSVVPAVSETLTEAVQKALKKPVFVVTPEVKLPFQIATDNPAETGADILSDIAGALSLCDGPLITIDMGTATVISVVDERPAFTGCLIRPGVRTSLTALASHTASLPSVSLKAPAHVIEKTTVESMKSGILFGTASSIDGLIDRIEEETGQTYTVFATGGLSSWILPFCKHQIYYEPELLLKGIWRILEEN